jgi:hypothetical protein
VQVPKRIMLLRIGFALLVVGCAFVLIPTYDEYCQHAYADEKYCAAHKVVVQLGAFFETYNGALTAIATALLAGITWGLVAVAREQTKTTQAQLRAYVFSDSLTLWDGATLTPPVVARANQPGIFFIWKNTGQTPAINLVSWARIAIIRPTNEHRLFIPKLRLENANTLGANQGGTKTLWYRRTLTPQNIADIAAGRLAIYFYGRIEYRDVFDNDRWTNFRFVFVNAIFPRAGGCFLNVSQRGNDHY